MKTLSLSLTALLACVGLAAGCSDTVTTPATSGADPSTGGHEAVGAGGGGSDPGGSDPGGEGGSNDGGAASELNAGAFTVQLPSEVAGEQGLAVRVFHPASDDARFDDGAPIVVSVPGGWSAGGLQPEAVDGDVATHGFIKLTVLLPGGTAMDGSSSGGDYDYRGSNCVAAIRDVLRYAAGELADSDGETLVERLPFALTDEIGLYGGSNGGNLAIVALAEHGAAIPSAQWLATWESPIGDQYAAVELNKNPFYTPGTCGTMSCPTPSMESQLRFDPSATTVAQGTAFDGALFLDADASGEHDPAELQFGLVLGPSDGPQPKIYFSVELTQFVDEHSATIYGGETPPTWLATADDAAAFWQLRDGAPRIAEASENFPSLLVVQHGTQQDHVQSQPDYPHSRSAIAGWLAAGHGFVRMNPDAAYLSELSGVSASALPDNDVGSEVPWPDAETVMIPEGVAGTKLDPHVGLAGMIELMDRTHHGDLSDNLDAVLE